MSGARTARPRRRTGAIVLSIVATLGVVGIVASAVVVAQGYDAQHVARQEAGVWVYRDAGQYARVDTDLNQIDTVRDAEDPRAIVQSGAAGVVLTDGLRKRWTIDGSDPAALVSTASTAAPASTGTGEGRSGGARVAGESTPTGTREVVSSGDWSAYLTDAGKVYVARIGASGAAAVPAQIDPLQAKGGASSYLASAIAVADDGQVVLYSAKEGAIRRYDAQNAAFVGGPQAVPSAPRSGGDLLLTTVGGRWALGQPGHDRVWIQGAPGPVSVKLAADATAEQGSSTGDRAYFADADGLVEVVLAHGTARRIGSGGGTPAAPVVADGTVYAAWLGQDAGRLWSSTGQDRQLVVPSGTLSKAQTIVPVLASNGSRAVLEETGTGLLWSVPDGTPIPLSQWTVDRDRTTQQAGTVQVPDVAEEEPPVAEPDAFGVRAGATVTLPVLLNDHDPNKRDVLTIDPASIAGGLADPGFGTVSLAGDDQQLVVDVHAQSGSTTLSYAVTDGQETSAPASVTLHVVASPTNSPPQWCGVEGCLQTWPSVTLEPGATTSVPVLDGWVDPEGDPFVLSAATADDPRGPLTVVPTADGRVAIRHNDPNAGPGTYAITVTVTDARGASASKQLTVTVAGGSALSALSFAAVGRVGEPVTASIAPHVEGGSGSYRLLDAVASDAQRDAVNVVPNAAAGEIVLNADKAGQYVVTYTVQDTATQAEQTAQLRFSAVDGAGALGVPALTAFVRPQQDTTLDVLGAVQNTTGRVLAIASATTADPGLTVSVIGGSQLRLSGTTADGQPGRVGTVQLTVSDGSGATASGQVTVFLTLPTTGVAPIAIPDAVTVRAGELVDIPVTANDIAPRGEQLELSPQVQGSGAKGELAFASGQDIRYLAPATAGVRTLRYSVSLAGDPQRTASAAITVTVVGASTNHAPEPTTVTARAMAGQSVTIPIPTTTADPDGDATTISQIDQPKAGQGTALIAADGVSIRYTAPPAGVADGQVVFGYTLSDGHGATGSAQVRVAVLGGRLADVAPVTYADAVRAVSGASAPLTVQPLANDSDPAGGALKLVSVVPDAPDVPGDPEFARLTSLIAPGTDLAQGIVQLRAGDVEGVHAYVYTVESSLTSSTAQGLIVVTVAPGATAIPPTVTDTVVTAANRSQLGTGIDVVSGKTQWSSGQLDQLTLSIWGDEASRYTVNGFRIQGPDPVDGALVPFKLAGVDASGAAVAGYGFLRIPPLDDMRLQPRPGAAAIKVGEEESATAHLSDLVEVGAGDRLEQKGGDYTVQRGNAACRASGAGDIVYDAGRDAPFTDSCTVLVRIAGQDTWTALPIPVTIQPKAPQAILDPLSRTIAPGTTQTIDLYDDLTRWEGGRVGDPTKLDYHVAYAGSAFDVSLSGRTLTVSARADAHPGARESVPVSVTAFGGLSTTVSLVVGIAPADAPRPLTFTRSCSVNQGASCTIPVVGIGGEYDPFAGKAGSGLKLVGIGQTSCQVATITTNGTSSVTATWPSSQKPPGGSCVVPYTVADAQGRTGSAILTVDVQGYPAQPDSLTTAGYTGSTATLLVDLGEAATAHPPVTGVAIYEHGRRVDASCSPASAGTWSCTVDGLQNGQHHQFTARAVNAVGESLDTSPVESWAYQSPTIQSATAQTVYVAGETTQSVAVVDIAVTAGDDTDSFIVRVDGASKQTLDADHGSASARLQMAPGPHRITFTPVSQYQPPLGSDSTGDSQDVLVTAAGAPIVTAKGKLTPRSNTSAEYTGYAVDANSSSAGVTTVYAIYQGAEPACTMGTDGKPQMPGSQASPLFSGLQESQDYAAKACSANGFGSTSSSDETLVWTSTPPPAGPLHYSVAVSTQTATHIHFAATGPTVPPTGPYKPFFKIYGSGFDQSSFALDADHVPNAPAVRYCRPDGQACSDPTPITATGAPTEVDVSVQEQCSTLLTPPAATDVVVSSAARSSATVTVESVGGGDDGPVMTQYTIQFSGAFASLGAVYLTRCTA